MFGKFFNRNKQGVDNLSPDARRKQQEIYKKSAIYNDKPSSSMFDSLVKNGLMIRPKYASYSVADYKIISSMFQNISVTGPLFKLIRDLSGRRIEIVASEHTDYDYNSLRDIRLRFKHIKGWDYFIEQLCITPFVGICMFEKIYWIDPVDGQLKLKELVQVPIQYIKFDTDYYKDGYYIEVLGQRFEATPDKFITAVYNPTVEYPFGQSLFRYGMVQAFQDLSDMEAQLRHIQKKFGNAIPIFGYDPDDATTPEGREKIAETAKMIAEINDMSVIGVPIQGAAGSVKESFQFIDMSQLKSELHEYALNRVDEKIEIFLTGALFAKGDRGSFARDAVQEGEKNKVTEHIGSFVSIILNDLLNHDALLYGYNPYNYTFVLEQEKTQTQILGVEKLEAEVKAQQGDASIRLTEAASKMIPIIGHMKFLGMTDEDIAIQLETRIELVSKVEAKELENLGSDYIGQNLPQTKVDDVSYAKNKDKGINE